MVSLRMQVCLLLLAFGALVDGASFSGGLTLNTNSPGLYSKLEVSFSLSNSYSNPYDTNQIAVDANFTSSSGASSKIPCFPFQQYVTSSSNSWSTSGSLHWLCRFSPTQVGAYKFTVVARDSSSTSSSSGAFNAVSSKLPGFIHRSDKDRKYLVRSDTKKTFFAVGENMAWWTSGIHDYDGWVSKLAAAGGNYIRLWIGATDFAFAIEENLGDYSSTQEKAAFLDYLITMAEQKGVTVLMCLNFHGDFSTTVNSNWARNPYNSAKGGPLSNPSQVWTNSEAISLFERRYRYVVARWGYSTSVHAWELWNEMDWIDNYANDVSQAASWHSHFYNLLHQLDPFGHVITTSYAEDKNNQPIDQIVDYTQIHQYNSNDFVTMVQSVTPSHVNQYNKPNWIGEMGVSWESGQTSAQEDPNGISLHNVQWASLVFGAAGGGFSWWWDSYVEPKNLYYRFTGITRFLEGETLDTHQFSTVQVSVPSNLRSWALRGADGYYFGWVQAGAHTWSNIHNGGGVPTVNNPSIRLACANDDNNNTVEIWNTVSGNRISFQQLACQNGQYSFQMPTINGNNPDYAFKVYPGALQNHTFPTLPPPPTPPPSNLLPDWAFCTMSSQCADACCSKQYSSDGQLKCTPGGSADQCVTGQLLPDWDFCTVSSQCEDGCCSKQYSGDGKLKCTPGGSPDQCVKSIFPLLNNKVAINN